MLQRLLHKGQHHDVLAFILSVHLRAKALFRVGYDNKNKVHQRGRASFMRYERARKKMLDRPAMRLWSSTRRLQGAAFLMENDSMFCNESNISPRSTTTTTIKTPSEDGNMQRRGYIDFITAKNEYLEKFREESKKAVAQRRNDNHSMTSTSTTNLLLTVYACCCG